MQQSTDDGATRSWREEAETVEGDERGGSRATQQSPNDVTGKMAGGEGEERDDHRARIDDERSRREGATKQNTTIKQCIGD